MSTEGQDLKKNLQLSRNQSKIVFEIKVRQPYCGALQKCWGVIRKDTELFAYSVFAVVLYMPVWTVCLP